MKKKTYYGKHFILAGGKADLVDSGDDDEPGSDDDDDQEDEVVETNAESETQAKDKDVESKRLAELKQGGRSRMLGQ